MNISSKLTSILDDDKLNLFPSSYTSLLSTSIHSLQSVELSSISSPLLFNNTATNSSTNKANIESVYFILFIIPIETVFGNIVLIYFVFKNKCFGNKNTTNYFISSLAISDLIVGAIVIPFGVLLQIYNKWIFSVFWCDLWQSIDFFACTASIFNLIIISADRYLAIKDALTYNLKMNKIKLIAIIFSLWFIAGLISFTPLVVKKLYICNSVSDECKKCRPLFNYKIYIILLSITTFYIPLVLMVIINYRTYLIAKSQILSLKCGYRYINHKSNIVSLRLCYSDKVKPSSLVIFNQIKAAKILGIITGIFIICWLPYFILYTGQIFFPKMPKYFIAIASWLGWLNSGLNPIIYTFLNKKFRKYFLRIFNCQQDSKLSSNTLSTLSSI